MAQKRPIKKRVHGNAACADTKARQVEVLKQFSIFGNIGRACLEAGIPRRTVYNWKGKNDDGEYVDPEFMKIYEVARGEAVAVLEAEAWRRAVEGDECPITVAGERVDVYKKSDTLLIFLLKAHDPAKYRDRYDVNLNANVNLTGQVHLYMPDNGRGPSSGNT